MVLLWYTKLGQQQPARVLMHSNACKGIVMPVSTVMPVRAVVQVSTVML